PLVNLLGSGWVGRFLAVLGFGRVELQGDDERGAAAFLSARPVPFVGQEMAEGGEQESAKATPIAVGPGQPISFQQTREEFLRQILGILWVVTAPPHVGIKWVPINRAEMREGGARARAVLLRGRQHDGPMRRGKDGARSGSGSFATAIR